MWPAGFRPGKDVAGVVVWAAEDGSGPAVGEQVVAHATGAGWAERVAVATDRIAALPSTTATDSAAALPLAGLTALLAREIRGNAVLTVTT